MLTNLVVVQADGGIKKRRLSTGVQSPDFPRFSESTRFPNHEHDG